MRKLGLFLMFLFISSLSWSAPLTAGYVPKAKTGKVIVDSAIYENGGNVGIGSTEPRGKLDVDGSPYFNGIVNASGLNILIDGFSYFSNNVGIGSIDPAARLDIVGVGTT